MLLSIDALVGILADPTTTPGDLRAGRYVVLHGLDPSVMRDPIPRGSALSRAGKKRYGFRAVGESTDLLGALQQLWEAIAALWVLCEQELPAGTWQQNLTEWLQPLSVPESEEACISHFAVGAAREKYPRSRYVVALFADAPCEGEAAAIVEVPSARLARTQDAALLKACKAGDLLRARELLAQGARPDATDPNGDSPLHFAVARRHPALAAALVEAGADPDARARFGNAPVFASLNARKKLGPFTTAIEDEAHFALLSYLVEHGASAKVRGQEGDSLADLAASSLPFREDWVRFFVDRGASSRFLRPRFRPDEPLAALLNLPHGDAEELARVPGRIRLLGMLGCDPNKPGGFHGQNPVQDFLTVGYHDREVAPAFMIAIAEALVAIGLRDKVDGAGPRPSKQAEDWATHAPETMAHYAEVARVLRGAR